MAKKVIRLDGLSAENIEKAAQELRDYADWVEKKSEELVEKLAKRGATVAELRFTGARYDGENDVEVRVDPQGNTATIYAEGTAVAFIEFGSGNAMGYGHPEAGKHGLGPGTWSTNEELGGKGHWNEPNGWYYKHGKKSHGNPPAMAMYGAVQAMTYELTMIAREVFGTA